MSSAIYFTLDQSKILSSGNGWSKTCAYYGTTRFILYKYSLSEYEISWGRTQSCSFLDGGGRISVFVLELKSPSEILLDMKR